MSAEEIVMAVGFVLAAYSVVGNDVIQTLGTFLSSNSQKKWYILWAYTGGIMLAVLVYGWFFNDGDIAYGYLNKFPKPETLHWWYALPPLILVVVTRFGIPVSTTFLVLSVFTLKLDELEVSGVGSLFAADSKILSMVRKSFLGYVVAFAAACGIYYFTSKSLEKRFIATEIEKQKSTQWTVLQWVSTGLLWTAWLVQDLANIYVYLPRGKELTYEWFIPSVFILLAFQAYIFKNRGGAVQKVVLSKTNTTDIRSATIIDFIYAIVLLVFKYISEIPMSTTWVFVGLLAGREFMIAYQLKSPALSSVRKVVIGDILKVVAGLLVSVALVFIIALLLTTAG